ncbi:hypothetical protein Taro_015378 [Colocasia esculenta]|uniref:Uncharacterized protein n=1 Tax=Colocasia esculenta TaxID=4460 RepID=A0A843UKN7_COLES|nr:hypothetical protein [Colocasia esculenta]
MFHDRRPVQSRVVAVQGRYLQLCSCSSSSLHLGVCPRLLYFLSVLWKYGYASARSREADSDQVRYRFNGLGRGVPPHAALDPPPSYRWWSNFPLDAPADSLLLPDTFSDDAAREWIVYLSSVLTSLGPRREAFLVQRARNLDDVWSAVSSGARELGLFSQTVIPRPLESVLPSGTVSPSSRVAQPETRVRPTVNLSIPSSEAATPPHDDAGGVTFSPHISMHVEPASPVHADNDTSAAPLLSSLLSKDQKVLPMPLVSEAQGGLSREGDVDHWDYELDVTDIPILNPDWDPSMENPEDPNFSIPFEDLMTMMEKPLPTPDQGALQDITAVVEPTAIETPPFSSTEGTSDQGNPLSLSTPIALNEEKSETLAPTHPLLDFSAPHEEKGIPVEPLPQTSDPAAIGQDELSPAPDPGKTNNNGGDSFVPLPPASDLPATAKEVEVAVKSSAHTSDMENSGMTSPLDDSEPDSSETCMISGPHSESTEPLSGETQQLSITFEAACDVDEVSSHPSPATSGLDRPLRALEVLENRLATLRREAIGTASQISLVRDQHTCLLSIQRKQSARADLLRMLTLYLDRSVAEDKQHSVALAARLLSLEAEQSRIHAAIAALESEADLLRASDVGA